MEEAPQLKFSQHFDGNVWNILADQDVLLIEVRNTARKEAHFSAVDLNTGSFHWRDRVLEEAWWVNASAITGGVVLFTIYLDTNNPDKKGLLAYASADLSLIWWNNDFSLSALGEGNVKGFTSKLGLKEVVLDLSSGKEKPGEAFIEKKLNPNLKKPVQYHDGLEHFATVKKFLADRLNFIAVSALEYLEFGNKIFISAFQTENDGLANYLFVLSAEGEIILKEKLDGPVKGIGMDTFFILNGCLIFVRNKVELVSYKII